MAKSQTYIWIGELPIGNRIVYLDVPTSQSDYSSTYPKSR